VVGVAAVGAPRAAGVGASAVAHDQQAAQRPGDHVGSAAQLDGLGAGAQDDGDGLGVAGEAAGGGGVEGPPGVQLGVSGAFAQPLEGDGDRDLGPGGDRQR